MYTAILQDYHKEQTVTDDQHIHITDFYGWGGTIITATGRYHRTGQPAVIHLDSTAADRFMMAWDGESPAIYDPHTLSLIPVHGGDASAL